MFGAGLKSRPDLKANSERLMGTEAVGEKKKIRCAAFDTHQSHTFGGGAKGEGSQSHKNDKKKKSLDLK